MQFIFYCSMQVIMEAHRIRGQFSNVLIKSVKFLNSNDCKGIWLFDLIFDHQESA